MILTHDDDDDEVCMYDGTPLLCALLCALLWNTPDGDGMYVCMYVSPSAPPELVTMNGHGWDGIQCPLLTSEKTLKRVEYNCIGGGGSYKGGAVPPTDLRGIAQ